jgi:hypothetical protein
MCQLRLTPRLTWFEIERLLLPPAGGKEIADANGKGTRLYATLLTTQYRQQAGNCIIRFINEAMKPARYMDELPVSRLSGTRDAALAYQLQW